MANIPLQYPYPYKTINSTGFTSSVEFVNITVLGDVTIDQNLTVSGIITTTDLTVGDDLTVGGQIDAQVLRAYGTWDVPTATVTGAGAWIGYDASGHTIFANRKATAGQTNSWRWYAFDHTNTFQGELMRLSNAGNLFLSGTRIEFPLVHFHQPPGTFPQYDFILPSSMGGSGQVLTSAGAGNPMYWTTPSGGGGGTVTNVTGTSPVTVTSPTTTPNISLNTIPTTLGGTGLTTVGTNGQVLTSNGTSLTYTTLATPVTSVSATSPLASSGGTTPTISIASSTGTGAVVLQDSPTITTGLTISVPTTGNVGLTVTNSSRSYLLSTSLSNQFQIRDVTGNAQRMVINSSGNIGFGTSPNVSYRILAGQGAIGALATGSNNITVIAQTAPGNASFRSQNDTRTYSIGVRGDTNDVFAITDDTASAFRMVIDTSGNVGIGTTTPGAKFDIFGTPGTFGLQYTNSAITLSSTINTIDILQRWYESTGNASYIDLSWIRTSTGSNWISAGQRFQAKTDSDFQGYIQFNGDNNYGLSFGTGFAATAHGVAERMRITGTGNVGIGTTTPGAKFDIFGTPGTFGLQYTNSAITLSSTINTIDILQRWYESTGNASYIDLSWIRTSTGSNWISAGQRFQAKTDSDFQGYIQFNGDNNYGLSFGTGFAATAHGVAERMRITGTGNVGIGTTSPTEKLEVVGSVKASVSSSTGSSGFISQNSDRIWTAGIRGDIGDSYNIVDETAAQGRLNIDSSGRIGIGTLAPTERLEVAGNIITNSGTITAKQAGTGVNAEITIAAGTSGAGSLANQSTLYLTTVGGGGGVVSTYIKMKYSATYGYHHEHSSDALVSTSQIVGKYRLRINSNNATDCSSLLESDSGNTGLELRAIGGVAYIDITAKTPSPGIDYDFRISKQNNNDVNFLNPHSGSFIFDKGVRATNFSTNGLQAFTYASGTFTPRIAMFYTIDNKIYECNAAPAGRDNIGITYSVQTGVWVRMGNIMMINMEIQYNQTYSGIFFNLNDLNIVAVIPEAACNPLTLGAVGVTGYPSRIRDRFVDNFQMNYWISNTAYAPGGTICEVQLRRDNTHNMCPWDPTNKTGERVNITATYYVSQ